MHRYLIAALTFGVAFAASAQSSPATDARTSATDTSTEASRPLSNRNCLGDTGSRITASNNARARKAGKPATDCVNANGRSYSRNDLRDTGETNTVDALRKLDPSIR